MQNFRSFLSMSFLAFLLQANRDAQLHFLIPPIPPPADWQLLVVNFSIYSPHTLPTPSVPTYIALCSEAIAADEVNKSVFKS